MSKSLSEKKIREKTLRPFYREENTVVRETYHQLNISTVTRNGKYPLYLIHMLGVRPKLDSQERSSSISFSAMHVFPNKCFDLPKFTDI